MTSFPDYVELMLDDGGEEFDPAVLSAGMEKGPERLRLQESRVVMNLPVTLLFESRQATLDFDDWYFLVIKRIGWFTAVDPRTLQVRTMRFKGGALGRLKPEVAGYEVSTRTATLEFLR